MKQRKLVFLLLGLSMISIVHAAAWTPTKPINNLRGSVEGHWYVEMPNNPHECNGGGTLYRLDNNVSDRSEVISMLMTAQVSGLDVRLRKTECATSSNQMLFNAVWLAR